MSESTTPKSVREWLSLGLGFAVLGIIGFGGVSLITRFMSLIGQADPTIRAAIIGAMVTVLVGLGGTLITQYMIKKRQAEDAHREAKIELYKVFLDMAAAHLAEENPNLQEESLDDKNVARRFFDFKTELLLRGSPGVISALRKFEDVSGGGGDTIEAVDNIYREMRKDIGLPNRGLQNKELAAVYIRSEDRRPWFR